MAHYLTDTSIERIRHLRSQGLTTALIAKRLSVTRWTIERREREALEVKPAKVKHKKDFNLTLELPPGLVPVVLPSESR